MNNGARDQQTICAVSTPPGFGGISVLRVSGPKAYTLVKELSKTLPELPESHRVYLTILFNQKQEPIDEVIVTFFATGKSFTGEEVVEISCHGNPLICESILNALIQLGARPADRGEFTYRAFMNNRLDLVQAEGVLALIESQSAKARELALRQLKGTLSTQIHSIEDQLIWCLAHLEASIDFSTEGLEVISDTKLNSTIVEIQNQLAAMVKSYKQGKILREGFRVALIGRPNVGKSSLLNFLSGEQRAIVTPIAGTTRDLIEAHVLFEGIKIIFIDTAGLREKTQDEVERIGISKSRQTITDSDLTLFIFDLDCGLQTEDVLELQQIAHQNLFVLGSKADLTANPGLKMLQEIQKLESLGINKSQIFDPCSTLVEGDKYTLLQSIYKQAMANQIENHALLSQLRHFEGLNKALLAIVEAHSDIKKQMGSEFVAIHLKQALLCVQEVLGKHFDDQILDRVFKEFCLGK